MTLAAVPTPEETAAASLSTTLNPRLAPQDLEAERSVLGGILLTNEALFDILEHVKAEDFYREPHRKIYAAMQELALRSEPIDVITLADELRKKGELESAGGPAYLSNLDASVPATSNLSRYARIVRDKALARRLIQAAHSIAREGYDQQGDAEELLNAAEQRVYGIRDGSRADAGSLAHIKPGLMKRWKHYEALADSGSTITGTATDLEQLDLLTCGFHRGNLILIAGRPSMGKTSLARTMLENVAIRSRLPAAMFSLEMTEEEVQDCLMSSQSGVALERLRSGTLSYDDWHAMAGAAERISKAPLYLDATPHLTVMELRSRLRRRQAALSREGLPPLSLVVVDYLQLMKPIGRVASREEGLEQISAGLKGLAKEFNVPVVALSQLNRELERRDDKRPQLSDLRGSGALEQDADLVVFVYRDEVYNKGTQDKGVAELIIAKQRNGRTGTVRVAFKGALVRFEDLSDEPPPPAQRRFYDPSA